MAKKKEVKKSVTAKPKAKVSVTKKTTVKKSAVTKKVATSKVSATEKAAASKSSATKKTTITKKTVVPKKVISSKATVKVASKKATKNKKVKGYSKKELNQFRNVIQAKKTEIIEQLQNLKDQMMDSSTGQYVNESSPYSLHMAEQGTDAQEREKLYLWAQRESKFLAYLEDALVRIEEGSYGVCLGSIGLSEGEHLIPKDRLLAVPHTQHCVACKNKISNKKGKL